MSQFEPNPPRIRVSKVNVETGDKTPVTTDAHKEAGVHDDRHRKLPELKAVRVTLPGNMTVADALGIKPRDT